MIRLQMRGGCRWTARRDAGAVGGTPAGDAMSRRFVLCLVVMMVLAGCRATDVPPLTAGGDSVAVDSVTGPAFDSLVPPDTAGAALDSVPLALRVDSLRMEMARLAAAVEALAPATDTGVAADSSLAPADTILEAASDVGSVGLRVLTALLVLLVAYGLVRGIVWVLDALAERRAARRLLFKRLIPIVRLVIWSTTIYVVVAFVFRVDRSGLVAAGAATGVAVGFAAQDILKNIFGGLIIILDKPFQVGDKIRVDGTYGEVVSIGLRATRIVTPDDNLVTVPNLKVVESQVANANAGALDCQVVVDLFLPGWVDVARAKAIAWDAAANSRYVYLEKPIVVNVKDEFRETFLTHLLVKAYVLDTRYEFAFASDVTETAKVEFRKAGLIEPLWPRRASADPAAPWGPEAT